MECRETQTLLHGYVDGELDLVRSLEVERHLETCSDCAKMRDNLRTVQDALRTPTFYHVAPPRLSGRIRSAVQREAKSRLTLRLPRIALSFAAAAALLAFMVWYVPRLRATAGDETITREVIAGHVRSLMANHLADVISTDRHTVKPWFNGKIDFAPPVIDLANQGFPLTGGRLDYMDDRPVAALVYRRQKHTINLFIWPESAANEERHESGGSAKGGTPLRELSRQGFNLEAWNQAGMHFWVISDLNAAELRDFSRRISDTIEHAK